MSELAGRSPLYRTIIKLTSTTLPLTRRNRHSGWNYTLTHTSEPSHF
jgi:hypothetical protein